jgi:phosphoglycerate dehydrogenase-like enzyme
MHETHPRNVDVLVTLPGNRVGTEIFPTEACVRLEAVGSVTYNGTDEALSTADLRDLLPGVDVVVTGWGSVDRLTDAALEAADALELLVHVGGAVPAVATEAVYDHGVTVCSAVRVMAAFVAEAALAGTLVGLRGIAQFDSSLEAGGWDRDAAAVDTLLDGTVGLVGLGSVGQELLKLLAPFGVEVKVYDPYVDPDRLIAHDFASIASLDAVLEESDVVSVHAGKTEETIHLLDERRLAQLKDGAHLVNTARGAIVDERALISELRTGRITAALDVFRNEPLEEDSPLRTLDNAVLTPHVAGRPTGRRMALAMANEVERFVAGEPLQHTVSRERFSGMTRNWLEAPHEPN